jgi:hypothetical protein
MSDSPHRSFEKINKADLAHLVARAKERLDDMLAQNETGRFYSSDSALMACLCQGAARHFVHGDRGVHDWDVVFFFRPNPRWKFPPRWKGLADFGPSRFGTNPCEPQYSGRRIDVMGRDIPASHKQSAQESIAAYLQEGRAKSTRCWAKSPMIALSPGDMLGHVIWEPGLP